MLDVTATAIMLIVIGWIYYGPWQDLCTDITRQILFSRRGDLFDLAARGRLSFDDENYRTIRRTLEQSIRYAHELTIWRHLSARALLKKMGKLNRPTALEVAIENLPDQEVRAEVRTLVRDAYLSLLGMTLLKSPVLLIVAIPIAGCIALWAVATSSLEKLRAALMKATRGIEAEAEQCV